MIYFIRAVQSGAVKIGTSNDPRGRLASLQTGSSEILEMIGVLPGQADEEKRLHRKFSKFRMHGEWFKGTPELIAEIKALLCDRGTASIQDLVDRTGAETWLVRGEYGDGYNGGPVELFCVCRDRGGRLFPDPNDLVSTVHPGHCFDEIELILNVTARKKYWPEDTEVLREALTSKASETWVADFNLSDQLFPVLSHEQRQAAFAHPTAAFAVGTPVIHPQYGIGEVIAVFLQGADRRARVSFVVGGEKTFVLVRSPLRAADPEALAAAKEAAAPKPELWRPAWMNPSNS